MSPATTASSRPSTAAPSSAALHASVLPMDEVVAQRVFDDCNASVVHVFWKNTKNNWIVSQGTGFIVWTFQHRCLVLTSNHCVVGENFNAEIHKVFVRLSGDATEDLEAKVIISDYTRDLAVIGIETVHPPPQPMSFAEVSGPLPVVGKDTVVAIGFCIADKDDKETDDENADESENEDPNFAYPEEPSTLPGKLIMEPLVINEEDFNEVHCADCGVMAGCSGGPLVHNSKVIGVATHSEIQIDQYSTLATVQYVFRTRLGLEADDVSTIKQLLYRVSELFS